MPSDKKILLTTVYIDKKDEYFDWVGTNIKWKYRFSRPRKISYALRFIKQNIPEIDILEHPTWEEYNKALDQNWDVVGFSFYLNDVYKIQRMVASARDKNIPTLWGGNYGVLTEGMEKIFDKIFVGYAEHEIARFLNKKITNIIHPPIINILDFGSVTVMRFGVMFTSRGCTHACKFCQTPKFQPSSDIVPLSSLERLIKYYKSVGINIVGIFDENFGLQKKHAMNVVKLLNKYNMYWACMARADFVAKQIKNWTGNGGKFIGAGVGIESFNSDILKDMNKKFDQKKILADLKTMKKYDIGILGYYMMGFEKETEKSIKHDLRKLTHLKNDLNQITIVTPLPKTELWEELDANYGIVENNYEKFDTKHLVWRHPNLSKEQLEKLLDWGLRFANPKKNILKMVYRFQRLLYQNEGLNSFTILPKSMYYSKKFEPDGYKIFFDEKNEGKIIEYKFDYDGKKSAPDGI